MQPLIPGLITITFVYGASFKDKLLYFLVSFTFYIYHLPWKRNDEQITEPVV